MNWIRTLVQRWRSRNLTLACPNCRSAVSSQAFGSARYMLGDEKLTCEHCDKTSSVTLWRFEGLSRASSCQTSGADLRSVS